MQPEDQCARWTICLSSKQRNQEMPDIMRVGVPLLHDTSPKVFKNIEIQRQKEIDLRVTINRDCLFAHDAWEAGQIVMLVGSQHVDDPNKVCPCRGMSFAEVLELPKEAQDRLALGEGHKLNLFHAASDKKEKGSKTGKKGKQDKKEKHGKKEKDSLPAGFQG